MIPPRTENQLSGGWSMRYEQIEVGVEYAVKLKGEVGIHMRVDAKVDRARKIKIVHLEGELAGMDEFVKSGAFLVPWGMSRSSSTTKESRGTASPGSRIDVPGRV
jgi:hypothetical protein